MITELFYSSGVYTTLFLDTDAVKIALMDRKVSGAFEKRAPGPKKAQSVIVLFKEPF